MSSSTSLRRSTLIAGLVATLLSGCTSVPHDAPRVQTFTARSVGLGDAAALPTAGTWWTAFNDPQLDRIHDRRARR